MNTIRRFGCLVLLVLVGVNAPAQLLTNAAGTWNNLLFSTPARLTLQKGTCNLVHGIDQASAFDRGAFQITVSSNGSFSGHVSGTLSPAGPGQFLATVGTSSSLFSVNAGGNFAFSMKSSGDNGDYANDVEVLLKAPATMSTNTLAGTWKTVSLGTPAFLGLVTNTNGHVMNIIGRDEFYADQGTLITRTDGTFTLTIPGEVIEGSFVPGSNGALQVTPVQMPPDPPMSLTFYINEAQDIMACVHGEENYQELIIAVRKPTNAAVGNMKGLWRPGFFETPSELTMIVNEIGELQDVPEANEFGIGTEAVTIGYDGAMIIPADSSVGRMVTDVAGNIVVSMTNAMESSSQNLAVNASQDVFIGMQTGSQNELVLGVRAPAQPPEYQAWEVGSVIIRDWVQPNQMDLCWAPDTNRFLQFSTNLTTWSTISNTVGQSSYEIFPRSGSNRFYRVVELP